MLRSGELLRGLPLLVQGIVHLVTEINVTGRSQKPFCWLCWLMLADADEAVCQQAIARIVQCSESSDELRPYELSTINFDWEHYT